MKKVLIPTDFSENAYRALSYATELFGKEPTTFYLLHSIESEVSRSTSRVDIGRSEDVIDELVTSAETQLEELKDAIAKDGVGHEYETMVTSRRLSKEVNYCINAKHIDFVIMGTKGQTRAQGILLGSNTVRLIKNIKNAPLMVVPEEMIYRPLRKIAFATGLEFSYQQEELLPLRQLTGLDNGGLQILHVRETEKLELIKMEHLSSLREQLDDVPNTMCWIQPSASKTEAITDHVYSNDVDLLAMIYYKHGFLKSLFRESIVKKIGLHPSIPFLMIPAAK